MTFYYFAVNGVWNDLRYQDRMGEHNKQTKDSVRGPNARAQGVGFLVFLELVFAVGQFGIVVVSKLSVPPAGAPPDLEGGAKPAMV